MDRLNRTRVGCGLALALGLTLAAPGCKSAHSTVPPGRPYSNDGRQAPPISFSSDPHPMAANSNPSLGVSPLAPNGMPTSPGGIPPQFGIPTPSQANMGAPTPGMYGGPGTTGLSGGPAGGMPSATSPAPTPEPFGAGGMPSSR